MPRNRYAFALLFTVISISDARGEVNPCASISGRYQFFGEALGASPISNPRFDTAVFSRYPVRGHPKSFGLLYKPNEDLLEVTIEGEDLTFAGTDLKIDPGHFVRKVRCDNGSMIYELNQSGSGDGTPVSSSQVVRLSREPDGSLRAYVSVRAVSGIDRHRHGEETTFRFLAIHER